MEMKFAQCVNKGMQRDYSMNTASQEFAYENKNIRITTTGNESFLSITNEKSTNYIGLIFDDGFVDFGLNPTILGCTTIENELILFVTRDTDDSDYKDFIFKVIIDDYNLEAYVTTVYHGNLGFNINNPIECIPYYESENVKKVYWVDGLNQPRVVNICKLNQTNKTTNLDFIPKIEGDIKVSVEKQYDGRGVFPSGVIQYYITYYNKFGQESNAVYATPLYSLSPSDRGGKEDETQTCSFKLSISNVDTKYDNIRVYSLIRTSLNTTPVVSIVGDLEINKENLNHYYEIIDDNYGNINVASSDILFLGGNTITASTIEQKDNTLFLGNISSIANNDDYTELKELLEDNRNSGDDGLTFISRPIEDKSTSNEDYGYSPNMDLSSKDRGFKYLEWYRFGLQFQNETGEWGNTLWLNDKRNHLRPNIVEYEENDTIIKNMYDNVDNFHSLSAIKYTPSDDIKAIIKNYNSKKYRLVMAEHNSLSRTIKTQGIVMPTLFNLKQRKDGTCFGSPIWSTSILRNNLYHYDNIDLLSPTTEGDDYYLNVHPAQQLDSTLYEIKDGYTTEDGHTMPDGKGKALFKILPSATINATTVAEQEYLTRIEVEIEVYRGVPESNNTKNYLSENDFNYVNRHALGGPSLVQDMFFFRIKPFTKNKDNGVIEEQPIYTLRELRLAGKVENTIDALIIQMAGKTWKDYKNDGEVKKAANGKDLDFINSSQPILNKAEIITAEKFNEERKTSSSKPNFKKEISLDRNGDLDINLQLTDEFKNQYFIDANSCNLWCPNVSEIVESNANFRIVGALEINNTISDYEILTEGNVIGGTTYTNYEHSFNRYDFYDIKTGITSYPLWPGVSTKTMYWLFPWNQSVILNHVSSGEGDVGYKISLKNKTFANLWKTNSNFLETPVEYGTIDYKIYSNNPIYYKGDLYEGKPQNVLFPVTNRRSYVYSEEGLTSTTDFKIIENLIENNETFIQKKADGVNSNVNIKYSSTDHLFFNLGTINGFNNVLPTYNIPTSVNYGGNIDITNNTEYPTTRQKIDYKLEGNPGDVDDFLVLAKEEQALAGTVSALFKFVEDPANYPIIYYFIVNMIGDTPVNLHLYFSADEFFKFLKLADFVKLGNYSVLCGDSVLNIKNIELEDENTQRYIINFTIEPIKEAFKTYSEDLVYLNNNGDVQKLFENNNYKTTLDNPNPSDNKKIFIGEFYVPYDPSTFMGGNTENALELNTFIPISEPTPIGETIYGFEGDTYYQQWDCLRIYPTSEDDVNKVVDVVSAMIETNINLDGDTREARGRSDMINVRPDKMVNQINTVYSQSNNYVTSKILDEKFEDSTHPLQYWWSLTKTPNSDIDTWTGVNLTSVAELDGDKGSLNKIKRWNNQLFAFQDKAIALINFNNQTTIATQEGLPVEISNSGRVNGHYYITTNNGCKNKWSIVESPNGLYFIDSYNKSINLIGDGIKSLSQLNLFQDWIEQKEKGNIWNPTRNLQAFKGFYDPIHKEVYFVDGEDCICYNELLQQFTSFYDYQKMNYMFLIDNHIYSIPTNSTIFQMFEGFDYCNLYNKQCDYYIQYKINNEPFIDKTWTNLEYRADVFNEGNIQTNEYNTNNIVSNETFDLLKVWNEYQNGELDLTKVRFGYLKEAKPKFRIWRTNLPRAKATNSNKFGLDRIRNPWIMLELKKSTNTNKRMEFHDLIIKYVI